MTRRRRKAKNMNRELWPVTKYLDWIGLRLKTDQLTIQLHFSSFTKQSFKLKRILISPPPALMLFQVAPARALILRMGRRLLLASGLLVHYCHHCRGVQGVLVFTVRLQRNYKGSIGKGRRWGYKEKVLESRLLPRSSSTSPINQTELGGPVLILFNAISNVLNAETVLVSVNALATELYPISKFPFSTSSILILLWPLWILWATAD